jgi:intracellular sulfur oxidation DsrE/DsrF family protein
MNSRCFAVALITSIIVFDAWAAEPTTGPVIKGYGPTLEVPDSALDLADDQNYRVVFDVARSPDDPAALNRSIETVARFLNMHARAGVSPDRLNVALVLHGGAGKDALSDQAYAKRHGQPNPNTQLMQKLGEAGVQVYLCGQTAGFREYLAEELAEPVKMSLSAMTALVELQSRGYSLIAF